MATGLFPSRVLSNKIISSHGTLLGFSAECPPGVKGDSCRSTLQTTNGEGRPTKSIEKHTLAATTIPEQPHQINVSQQILQVAAYHLFPHLDVV